MKKGDRAGVRVPTCGHETPFNHIFSRFPSAPFYNNAAPNFLNPLLRRLGCVSLQLI